MTRQKFVDFHGHLRLPADQVTIVSEDDIKATPPSKRPSGKLTVMDPLQTKLDLRQVPVFPWENADPRVKINTRFEVIEPYHLKALYLIDKVPKQSLQKLIRDGFIEHVETLLEQHVPGYKRPATT